MIEFDGFAWAVRGKSLLRWTPAGYRERRRRPAESKSQCSHRPLLLRSLPPVIVPNGIPAVPVSGFNAKIPMTENCANFAFPLFGTGKLREFCFPAISGRENCASFAFPLYRDGKTARVVPSRNIRAPKLSPRSFGDSA